MAQQTRPKSSKEIARAIADDLFVNGRGEKADRLVLWVDADERNLGGWAHVAVVTRIVNILKRMTANG